MVDSEGGRLSRPDDDDEFEEAFGVLTASAAPTVREFEVDPATRGSRTLETQASAGVVARSGRPRGRRRPNGRRVNQRRPSQNRNRRTRRRNRQRQNRQRRNRHPRSRQRRTRHPQNPRRRSRRRLFFRAIQSRRPHRRAPRNRQRRAGRNRKLTPWTERSPLKAQTRPRA